MEPQNSDAALQDLRQNVLSELSSLGEYMATDDNVSYELLLSLARNTGRSDLLQKAFEKIQKIEDPRQKSDALVDLLDEIELQLAPAAEGQEQREGQEEQPEENAPEEDAEVPEATDSTPPQEFTEEVQV